ncbi:hypothetical protein GEV33_010128 [Tenebrio molitor]|uniref:Uncharacterized protein n=1 Tax=Tenebrio molitor TaxID=7067 RepID=A0A8J6LB20_TENMO|nr:hypothetical protein GEV33_010128 [Tenebrio molitor]
MPLSQEDSARAIALVHVGFSIREAANSLGFARSSVHRAVLRFRQTGGYTRRPGSGRRRSTSARDNRYITMLSLRNRHMTAVEIRNQLERGPIDQQLDQNFSESNGSRYSLAMNRDLLSDLQMDGREFGEDQENATHLAIFLKGSVLMEDQLWYGEGVLHDNLKEDFPVLLHGTVLLDTIRSGTIRCWIELSNWIELPLIDEISDAESLMNDNYLYLTR